jgi:FlaA1/EpsC-like NDP-sugar epimerase
MVQEEARRRMGSSWRSLLIMLFDLVVVSLAWASGYALRFNFDIPEAYLDQLFSALPLLLLAQALIFHFMGLYRGIWIFASLPDLVRILKAAGVSALLLAALSLMLSPAQTVPRSILVLYPIMLLIGMAGGRAAYRMWKEHTLYGDLLAKGRPALMLGAGRAGAVLMRELERSGKWNVVGFLDDDPAKRGREIMGRKVLGPLVDLAGIARDTRVSHAIIAMPSLGHDARRKLFSACVRAGVTAYTTPSVPELLVGENSLAQVRKVALDDLLGREPVRVDAPQVEEMVGERVVMVTGAGGSIGSELCRQLARFKPAQLILYENSEYALYQLCEEFSEHFPEIPLIPLAGDVRDRKRVTEVVQRYAPAAVFHAAAYKHVPLMEDHNAWEAVRNNVYGTWVVADTARRYEVPRFVFVSTDKAVNPTNVMGASKRLAEMVCLALQDKADGTRFEMVRFGNVLGSAGSVIPKFQAQIERGGAVTVTHPEITRYFMSIPEAAQLVLQAAAMGEGGEIFVLDMGRPIRIADLARDMIRLAGKSEDEVPIEYTGLRPGEKLYEEVLADAETTRSTHHPKVRVAKSRPVGVDFADEIVAWLESERVPSDGEVRRDLRRWVPEYSPATVGELTAIDGGRAGDVA